MGEKKKGNKYYLDEYEMLRLDNILYAYVLFIEQANILFLCRCEFLTRWNAVRRF